MAHVVGSEPKAQLGLGVQVLYNYLSSLSSYIYISNYSLQLLDVGFTKIKRVKYMIFIL